MPDPAAQPVIPYQPSTPDSLTKFDLAVLAVRLFGLFCLFQSLLLAASIPAYFIYFRRSFPGNWPASLLSMAAPCLLYAAAGVAALCHADHAARRIFPEFASGATLSMTGRDLQTTLFSVVGLWMVVTALPTLLRTATLWWFARTSPNYELSQILPDTVRDLSQILIGLLLFARAKGLSLLWHHLRTAGTNTTA